MFGSGGAVDGWIAVTGATSGIGEAVARQLVAAGRRVVLVVRRPEAGHALARAWAGETQVVVGDLSTRAGIEAAAAGILAGARPLDGVVHVAGVWPRQRELGPDGLEIAYVVNHLAPFVLDARLEPALAEREGRVVLVSAGLYPAGRIDPERTPTGADFGRFGTYAATKRCAVLVGRRRAGLWRERGITWNAVHPGVVNTALGQAGSGALDRLLRWVKRWWATPDQGARGPVRLIVPGLAGTTDRWFDQLQERPWHSASVDEPLTDRLWAEAMRWV
jgi:NAD(P)-dependent dehydrogenase (short-subunit alcohol dehydrogenase family)